MSEQTPLHLVEPCPHCDGKGVTWRVNPQALRESREARGLSLRQMAKKCAVSVGFLSDVERGRRAWSPRLLKGYGAHLHQLPKKVT